VDDAIPTLTVLVAKLDRVIATWAVGFEVLDVVLPTVDRSLVGWKSGAHGFDWAKDSPGQGGRSPKLLTQSKCQTHALVKTRVTADRGVEKVEPGSKKILDVGLNFKIDICLAHSRSDVGLEKLRSRCEAYAKIIKQDHKIIHI